MSLSSVRAERFRSSRIKPELFLRSRKPRGVTNERAKTMVDSIDVLVVAVAVLYTLFVVLSIWRDYRQSRTARYGNWTMVRRFRDSEGTEIAVFRWKP